ncbi:MAG: nucleotidyltransferase domain-containing protein [Planctomycetaceae bacterium]|nr:nucleotidyltransferase domain-containing protein [Planctomycetaceae bacterium]
MTDRVHHHPLLIYSIGTQVICRREILGEGGRLLHPSGSVCVVIKAPKDLDHNYRVRFLDGLEVTLPREDVVSLAYHQEGQVGLTQEQPADVDLFDCIIYRCIIGSRAYGLDGADSDTDYRGIYLPPAELQWSLSGVPNQIEREETQEQYWELQRFLVFALKANPNVLECLYTPLIEKTTPLADELLAMRSCFLSRVVYQTYNGYVASQFKKMQADIRNQGQVKWKHVMHLLRLLLSGIHVLREGSVPVRVERHRDDLLAIKRGEWTWDATEKWRLQLHGEFDDAFTKTNLPERPDYVAANAFLIKARKTAL